MASKPSDGSSEPLQFQTWVLKVSIHCEGCKRKVKKVLQSVEGVFTTSIDSHQHKVTVTGSVDAETLIRRLAKTGKHAELWPEKAEKIEKKTGKEKNKEPQSDSSETKVEEQKKETEQHHEVKTPKQKPKPKPNTSPNNNNNNSSGKSKEGNKNKEGSTPSTPSNVQNKENGQIEEPKGEDKPPETPPTGGQNQTSPPEKKESESNGVAEKSGSNTSNGKNSKKKGKKGQKSNETENGDTPNETHGSTIVSPTPTTTVIPINYSPPRQHAFQYPSYGPPPQPVYGVSYNTAYPTNSSSYYAPAPVSEPYAYMHPQGYGSPPPLDSYEMHHGSSTSSSYSYPPPSDTFEMFSDENANGCWIM